MKCASTEGARIATRLISSIACLKAGLRPGTCAFAIAVLAGCRGHDTASAGKVENPQTWARAQLTSVNGVPATEIESSIQKQLAGPKLDRIDDDQWKHTKSLYRIYGNNPLWLTSDGLHKTRTKALTDAILAANADGLRLDDYPIGALAQAIATLKQTKAPTAEQLATADVSKFLPCPTQSQARARIPRHWPRCEAVSPRKVSSRKALPTARRTAQLREVGREPATSTIAVSPPRSAFFSSATASTSTVRWAKKRSMR